MAAKKRHEALGIQVSRPESPVKLLEEAAQAKGGRARVLEDLLGGGQDGFHGASGVEGCRDA